MMKASDWTERYQERKTGWDLGDSPHPLEPFIRRLPPRQNILIPGCGRGYEIAAFTQAGHLVTAIDYSEGAIEAARQVIGHLADAIICEDFFTSTRLAENYFDVCYERTFLCALPAALRVSYGKRIASLLRSSGVLAGVFLYGPPTEDGPPYPMDATVRETVVDPYFALVSDEDGSSGLPVFSRWQERWQVWHKR
jgi:SAM-dependent methyltransferase